MAKSIDTNLLSIARSDFSVEVEYYLSKLPFLGVEEKEEEVVWYWDENTWEQHKGEIIDFFEDQELPYQVSFLAGQNWNAMWEKDFSPVIMDSFCQIRAHFHDRVSECKYDILIDPKMAFGTGHHDTTYQMLAAMRTLSWTNKKVMDLGTGTGVLAILAEKMGALKVTAVDNDAAAVENAIENVELNGCSRIDTRLGTVSSFIDELKRTDIILANINRNVLLEIEPILSLHSSMDTELLLSGILMRDKELVREAYRKHWQAEVFSEKGEWVCLYGKKK